MFSFHQLSLWDAAILEMDNAMELDAFTRSSEISELGHLNTKKSPIVASYNSLRRKSQSFFSLAQSLKTVDQASKR